jgi:hypothetical protein
MTVTETICDESSLPIRPKSYALRLLRGECVTIPAIMAVRLGYPKLENLKLNASSVPV